MHLESYEYSFHADFNPCAVLKMIYLICDFSSLVAF